MRVRRWGGILGFVALGLAGPAHGQLVVRMPRQVEPVAAAAPAVVPSVVRVTQGGQGLRPDPSIRLDSWAGLIREASIRFGIPESWIREVMRMESGGNSLALSHAGAMGLMQVIPSTYAKLRWQHGLGPNPWEPRDNIMAGAAYIREMYDQYGFPGFLAAYNAGPGRVDGFMNRTSILPAETVNYLTVLGPRLQGSTVAEGPLAAFLNPRGPVGGQQTASTGPMRIDMRRPDISAMASLADATGLVPRGMLNGPQRIQMPSVPGAGAVAAPVPVPPAIVASLMRAAAR